MKEEKETKRRKRRKEEEKEKGERKGGVRTEMGRGNRAKLGRQKEGGVEGSLLASIPTHHSVLLHKDPASPKPHWTMRPRSLSVLSAVPSSCHPGPPQPPHGKATQPCSHFQFSSSLRLIQIPQSLACFKPSKKALKAVCSWETHCCSPSGSLGHAHIGVLASRVQPVPCLHTPGTSPRILLGQSWKH